MIVNAVTLRIRRLVELYRSSYILRRVSDDPGSGYPHTEAYPEPRRSLVTQPTYLSSKMFGPQSAFLCSCEAAP